MMTRDERIAILEEKHRLLLFQMMDNVLETCITTVQDGLYQLESPEDVRSSISASFVLVLVEKASQKCTDFSSSLVKLVNVGLVDLISRAEIQKMLLLHLLPWHSPSLNSYVMEKRWND